MGRRTFSREFKISAVGLVAQQGYTISQAAKSLGVDSASLRGWLKQYPLDGAPQADNANMLAPQTQPTGVNPPSPNRGVLNESTIGLNWWWNRYTRVQFNWIHSMPNYQLVPTGATAPVGYAPFDIFAGRFQIEF